MKISTSVRDFVITYHIQFPNDVVMTEFYEFFDAHGKSAMEGLHKCIFPKYVKQEKDLFLSYYVGDVKLNKISHIGVQVLYSCGNLQIK